MLYSQNPWVIPVPTTTHEKPVPVVKVMGFPQVRVQVEAQTPAGLLVSFTTDSVKRDGRGRVVRKAVEHDECSGDGVGEPKW